MINRRRAGRALLATERSRRTRWFFDRLRDDLAAFLFSINNQTHTIWFGSLNLRTNRRKKTDAQRIGLLPQPFEDANSGRPQLPENTLTPTKCQIPVTSRDLGNEPVIIQRVTTSKPRETDSTTHVARLQAINMFISVDAVLAPLNDVAFRGSFAGSIRGRY